MLFECQGRVSCCFKDKGPEKSEPLLLFSHSEDSAAKRFCCGRSFVKAPGERRTQSEISEQPPLSQRGLFQRSQCPFTHQFTLISSLRVLFMHQGVLPRNPAINQPSTESCDKRKKGKSQKPLFTWKTLATKAVVGECFSRCFC